MSSSVAPILLVALTLCGPSLVTAGVTVDPNPVKVGVDTSVSITCKPGTPANYPNKTARVEHIFLRKYTEGQFEDIAKISDSTSEPETYPPFENAAASGRLGIIGVAHLKLELDVTPEVIGEYSCEANGDPIHYNIKFNVNEKQK